MAEQKPKPNYSNAWTEARRLVWQHRNRLAIGLGLMLLNRVAGLVLPWSSRYLVDEVMLQRRAALLGVIAAAMAGATIIQAVLPLSSEKSITVPLPSCCGFGP